MIGRVALLFSIAILPACDDMPKARTEAEIQDIATDASTDATASKFSEFEERIVELEAEKLELEARDLELSADVSSAEASAAAAEAEIASLRSEYASHTH